MSSNSDAPTEQETTATERTSETSTNPTDGTDGDSRQTSQQNEESILESGRESFNSLTRKQQIVVIGAGITAIGSFLPWASAFGTTIIGVNGDGAITLVLGLAAGAVAYWMPLSKHDTNLLVTAVAGVLVALIGLNAATGIAAIGVYITLIGGLIIAYPGIQTAVSNYQRGSVQ